MKNYRKLRNELKRATDNTIQEYLKNTCKNYGISKNRTL
jgi:hypothetical protein